MSMIVRWVNWKSTHWAIGTLEDRNHLNIGIDNRGFANVDRSSFGFVKLHEIRIEKVERLNALPRENFVISRDHCDFAVPSGLVRETVPVIKINAIAVAWNQNGLYACDW